MIATTEVLEMIREELAEHTYEDPEEDYEYGYNAGLMIAAQIIDLYKQKVEKDK